MKTLEDLCNSVEELECDCCGGKIRKEDSFILIPRLNNVLLNCIDCYEIVIGVRERKSNGGTRVSN